MSVVCHGADDDVTCVMCVRVMMLLCSAGLLTYKLLQLQARLDAGLRGWSIADDGNSLSHIHRSVVHCVQKKEATPPNFWQ